MDERPIIIIKKRGKKAPHEAHGGSWKIAYADFVTAMMAFFLLMWLINIVNDEQRKGIADYFAPTLINTQTKSGSAGLLGGVNLSNPNNSSGKSSQERAKSTEIEVDMAKSKQQEAFQDKKDITKEATDGAKKNIIDPAGTEKIKKNDASNVALVKIEGLKENAPKAEATKSDVAKADAAKVELTKTDPAKVETKKIDVAVEKIVKVNVHENKAANVQTVEKEVEAKALNQAIKTLKSNNEANKYERSIASAMSDKKAERQKAIEATIAESKEKEEAIKKLQLYENEKLKEVAGAIKDLVQKSPELKELAAHFIIENRPEGLRIQLIDKDKRSMFATGSSSMTPLTKQLIKTVANLIEKMPNALVISGHTDAYPFVGTRKYSNWELSADRANATRRALEEFNIAAGRFESVMGKEATDPFVREDPFHESNRRISITLLREFGVPSSDTFKQMTGGG